MPYLLVTVIFNVLLILLRSRGLVYVDLYRSAIGPLGGIPVLAFIAVASSEVPPSVVGSVARL